MTIARRGLFPVGAALLLLAGCVSLEEQKIPKNAIGPDQRTLLLVYGAPTPIFVEDDTKVETAAKIVPGLGLVVKDAQDDTQTKRSKDLAQYLPPLWDPAAEFQPLLAKELKNTSGHPGKFIELSDAPELTADRLKVYNRAADVLDWQLRYYIDNPDHPVPRNYSTLLTLNDALIIDVDLAPEILLGDDDRATPMLAAVTRLVGVDSSHTIWRHEDLVQDVAGARTTYEFKSDPNDLLAKYRKLMPTLVQAVVTSYRKNLQDAGLFKMPTNGVLPYGMAASTAPARGAPAAMPYGMSPTAAMPYGMTPPAGADGPAAVVPSTSTR